MTARKPFGRRHTQPAAFVPAPRYNGFTISDGQRRVAINAMRRAHRELGVKRDKLGLGPVSGAPGSLRTAAAIVAAAPRAGVLMAGGVLASVSLPQAASAQVYVNEGADPSTCTAIRETGNASQNVTSENNNTACGGNTAATQTNRSVFYSNDFPNKRANSLSLGGSLFVNEGRIGVTDVAGGTYSMRLGSTATLAGAAGANAIAIGSAQTTTANGTSTTATIASGAQAIAIGSAAASASANAIAMGTGAAIDTGSGGATAIGQNANVATNAASSIALGNGANVASGGTGATAIGFNAAASANRAIAIGGQSSATAEFSAAFGNQSAASGISSVAVGSSSTAGADRTVAIGNFASATGIAGVAIGRSGVASGASSAALGDGATAALANSVAIGSNSTTGTAAPTGVGYASGTAAPAAVVSVGSATAQRRITNVSAGAAATDAINVGQLNTVAQNTATSLGGGAAYDATTGAYTAPAYAISGTTVNNVGAALTRLDTLNTAQGNSTASGLGGGATYNAATGVVSAPTFTIGGQNVTNAGAAFTRQDALVAQQGNTTASGFGGGSTFNASNGTVSAPAYTLGDGNGGTTTLNNVGAALTNLDSRTANNTNAISAIQNGGVGIVQRTATANRTALVANGGSGTAPGTSQQLTNLAAGAVSSTSLDAVNGSQLFTTNQGVSSTANALGAGQATIRPPTPSSRPPIRSAVRRSAT